PLLPHAQATRAFAALTAIRPFLVPLFWGVRVGWRVSGRWRALAAESAASMTIAANIIQCGCPTLFRVVGGASGRSTQGPSSRLKARRMGHPARTLGESCNLGMNAPSRKTLPEHESSAGREQVPRLRKVVRCANHLTSLGTTKIGRARCGTAEAVPFEAAIACSSPVASR